MTAWLHDVINWAPLGLPAFVVVVSFVVFFHELGHFLMARACGIGVEVFSIGFGGEIVGWNDRKGTRWKIAWLPLGGYVKFIGDAGAASTPDREGIEELSAEDKKRAFHLKPILHRALVVLAGPMANFLLAILLFAVLFLYPGAKALSSTVGAVSVGSPAAEAGLRPGDRITAMDGRKIRMFGELHAAVDRYVTIHKKTPMQVTVQRGGQDLSFLITPRQIDNKDAFGAAIKTIGLGVSPAEPSPQNSVYIPLSPWRAVTAATSQCWWISEMSLTYMWRMVSHQADTKQLSGPVGMAKLARSAASYGIYDLFYLIAFISVSIGLINLFPIPLLDGGHLLYYACEAVLGRPLKEQVQEFGFKVGLVLVLSLMVFATLNDLIR